MENYTVKNWTQEQRNTKKGIHCMCLALFTLTYGTEFLFLYKLNLENKGKLCLELKAVVT